MANKLTIVESGPWQKEDIPDSAHLYYRVPKGSLRADKLPHPNVFKENKGAMSADWDKYSTPEQTRSRQGDPIRFGVLKLPVSAVRAVKDLTVEHQPIYEPDKGPQFINRAHSGVLGIEPHANSALGYKERVRLDLLKIVGETWEIHPDATSTEQ